MDTNWKNRNDNTEPETEKQVSTLSGWLILLILCAALAAATVSLYPWMRSYAEGETRETTAAEDTTSDAEEAASGAEEVTSAAQEATSATAEMTSTALEGTSGAEGAASETQAETTEFEGADVLSEESTVFSTEETVENTAEAGSEETMSSETASAAEELLSHYDEDEIADMQTALLEACYARAYCCKWEDDHSGTDISELFFTHDFLDTII